MGRGSTFTKTPMPRPPTRWAPKTLCGAAILVALVASTVTSAEARTSHRGLSPAAGKPALCGASAVRVGAETNHSRYRPGQLVKMTSTITNVSSTPCSVWLGLDPGFSPSFIVVNAKHNEVWDRCWNHDQPGGCFEILYQHRLNPGRSYHTTATWDQGSGTSARPPHQVPAGSYTVETYYQYIGGAKVRIRIS